MKKSLLNPSRLGRIVFISGLIALLAACSSPSNANTTPMELLDRLIGPWKYAGNDFQEHWEQLSSTHYRGTVYRVFNGVLEPAQYLDIEQVDDSLIYTGTVIGAHESMLPIRFGLTSSSSNSLQFQNLTQSFPQHIEYLIPSSEIFQVKMSGTQEDQYREQIFPYSRIHTKSP